MSVAQIADLAAIVLLALAIPLAAIVVWRRRDLATSPLLSPLIAILAVLLVCYSVSVDRRYSARLVLSWIGYLAVFILAQVMPRRWVILIVNGIGWPVALACVWERLLTNHRVTMLQSNPNIMAGSLLSLMFLGSPAWAWAPLCLAALLATESRGALMGLLAAVATFPGPARRRYVAILLVLVTVVGLAAWRPATVGKRLATWQEALGLFAQRPVLGWGPGVYAALARNEPQHPHADNFILTVAVETGLVGLAAWLWLIVAAARLVARSRDLARLGLVAWFVHNLVDCTLWWYWTGIMVMISLAVVTQSAAGELASVATRKAESTTTG